MKRHLLFACLPLALVSSCGQGEVSADIQLQQNTYYLSVGESVALKVISSNPEATLSFLSGDETVVRVSSMGVLTAVGKGQTSVFVLCGNKHVRAMVFVEEKREASAPIADSGTTNWTVSLPYFGLKGDFVGAFEFVCMEEDTWDYPHYLRLTFDKSKNGQILSGLCTLPSSPYAKQSGHQWSPEYLAMAETLEQHLAAKCEETFTVHLYQKDDIVSGYFRTEEETLYKFEKQSDSLAKALDFIRIIEGTDFSGTDPIGLISIFLTEEEKTLEEILKERIGTAEYALLSALRKEGKLTLSKKEENVHASCELDKEHSEPVTLALHELLGEKGEQELGKDYSLTNLSASVEFQKGVTKYRPKGIQVSGEMLLEEKANTIKGEAKAEKMEEPLEKDFFEKLEEQLAKY